MNDKTPDYVTERIKTPATLKYIVENTTPVVCFGDIRTARALTIGINPSSSEFTKTVRKVRLPLEGKECRLVDLFQLGATSTESLSSEQVDSIWRGCLDYFDGPYYKKWFSMLQSTVLDAAGVNYEKRSAAHLDLIQWATDPLWQKMLKGDPAAASEHLKADFPFLERQLAESSADFIFLSGKPVIEALGVKFKLENEGKTKAEGKTRQYSLYVGKWRKAIVLGSTMNIPDAYTSNAHREYLSTWIETKL